MAFSSGDMGAGKEQDKDGSAALKSTVLHLDMDSTVLECRICQEEEDPSKLEAPCACSGTLKYAHRTCVQRWCDEKGDVTCEICQQPYKHGYTASSPSRLQSGSISIDIRDDWSIQSSHPIGLRDPRILALAVAQRQFLELDYEEYDTTSSDSAMCCRTVALILVTLLLLRHTFTMVITPTDSDTSTFLVALILRIVGFFLPCYIMVHGMGTSQREQQQGMTLTAAEVSILLQTARPEAIRIALAPAMDVNEQIE
ncbi:hypothetical protein GOP47_0012773 [Adiantum capillus-veneris]|uniref:RING-CH-type domain-containing protein n=1 Tax=Adiantum capillus-veneris TaxID=13818 RepID=A0A9D4ZG08_ADICA|nr:hypothetical protein GOP47_0012773 [Adiantum capillus-veneris]